MSGNSNYGNPLAPNAGCSGLYTCDIDTDALTTAADITSEAFAASSYGFAADPNDFAVFDFQVGNVTPGELLVLTTSAPVAADSGTAQGYGVFTCAKDGTAQCTTDNLAIPTSYCDSGSCINGGKDVVTFQLYGPSATPGANPDPVLYVVVDDAPACAVCDAQPAVTVTAKIEPAPVPEPRLWPVLGFAMLGLTVFCRRRVVAGC